MRNALLLSTRGVWWWSHWLATKGVLLIAWLCVQVILAPTSGVSYDKSCDIWSLGATLFTVAGGYLPYKFCEVVR